jgi:hypothetical protein
MGGWRRDWESSMGGRGSCVYVITHIHFCNEEESEGGERARVEWRLDNN